MDKLIATWEAAVANGNYTAVPHQLLPRHIVQSVAEFVATPLYKAYAGHFTAYDQPDDNELLPLICPKTMFLDQLLEHIAVQLDDGTYMNGDTWVYRGGLDAMVQNCTKYLGWTFGPDGWPDRGEPCCCCAAARLLVADWHCKHYQVFAMPGMLCAADSMLLLHTLANSRLLFAVQATGGSSWRSSRIPESSCA